MSYWSVDAVSIWNFHKTKYIYLQENTLRCLLLQLQAFRKSSLPQSAERVPSEQAEEKRLKHLESNSRIYRYTIEWKEYLAQYLFIRRSWISRVSERFLNVPFVRRISWFSARFSCFLVRMRTTKNVYVIGLSIKWSPWSLCLCECTLLCSMYWVRRWDLRFLLLKHKVRKWKK